MAEWLAGCGSDLILLGVDATGVQRLTSISGCNQLLVHTFARVEAEPLARERTRCPASRPTKPAWSSDGSAGVDRIRQLAAAMCKTRHMMQEAECKSSMAVVSAIICARARELEGRLKQFLPIPILRKFDSTIIDHRTNGELRRCRVGLGV
jgi:hypothetical protein